MNSFRVLHLFSSQRSLEKYSRVHRINISLSPSLYLVNPRRNYHSLLLMISHATIPWRRWNKKWRPLATLPPQCPHKGWHEGREVRWGETRWKERWGWDCTNKNAPFLKGRRWVWWSELGSVFQRLVIWSISRHRGLFRGMTPFVCMRVPLRMRIRKAMAVNLH